MKNEDPKTRQIEELKRQVRILTDELSNANETINWLSSLTGQNPSTVRRNINNPVQAPGSASRPSQGNFMDREGSNNALNRQDSAVTNRSLANTGQDGQAISPEHAD